MPNVFPGNTPKKKTNSKFKEVALTFLERAAYRLSLIRIPNLVCKAMILAQLPIYRVVFWLNERFWPCPKFDMATVSNAVPCDPPSGELPLTKNGWFDYHRGDNGDSCLWNGVYSAYKGDAEFTRKYLTSFVLGIDGGAFLHRGLREDGIATRSDASGDQLVGYCYAYSNYDYANKHLMPTVAAFFKSLSRDLALTDSMTGEASQFGSFFPNPTINGGPAAVILAALAASGHWDRFDELWEKAGYKYLLKYAAPRLKNNKAWFAPNVAMLALSVIERALKDKFKNDSGLEALKKIVVVAKAQKEIVSDNAWNIWLYRLAGMVPGQEANEYFGSFKYSSWEGSPFYPLGGQAADFVWQRSPFKKESNLGTTRLDYLIVKKTMENGKSAG